MRRAAVLLVLVLAATGVIALALRAGSGGLAVDPRASALPTAAVTDAPTETPSPSATASASADVGAVFEEIEAAVEELRGLPPADIGPPEVIGRDQLREELNEVLEAHYTPDERRADNIALRALGLLEEDQDYAELQLQLQGDTVLGFYDQRNPRMVVGNEAGVDALGRFIYAHEYTHALQFASFDLLELQEAVEDDDDRSIALTAVIEGDASVSMTLWAIGGGLTEEELFEAFDIPTPDTSGIPEWILSLSDFPYTTGFGWAQRTYDEGGFGAIDEAMADPPVSTEQIIHFEKWEAREQPVAITAPDLVAALGAGWEEVDSTTLGELITGLFLEHTGTATGAAQQAAEGWGGDRLVVASGPDGAFALAWLLTWDSQTDAAEFAEAYVASAASLPFPAELVELPDGGILVAHASSEALLAQTIAAAGG